MSNKSVNNDIKTKKFEGVDFSKYIKGINVTTANEMLDMYEIKKNMKEVFTYDFSCADPKGSLYTLEECGVTVWMGKKDIDSFDNQFLSRMDKLKQTHSVMVTKIDRDEKKVYVSSAIAVDGPKNTLISAMEQGIASQEYVVVPASIIKFTGRDEYSVALVNIGGLGIVGAIRLSEWSIAFTKSFRYTVKPGDVVNVAILRKIKWSSGMVYDCSRKATISFDPWKGIEEKLPVKTNVRVTCICKEEKKFFGTVHGIPELNVFCEYPDNHEIIISEGSEYVGYVYKVNEKKRNLCVRIREEL